MPRPRKSQVSLIVTPYYMNNIPVIHFFEASCSCSNLFPKNLSLRFTLCSPLVPVRYGNRARAKLSWGFAKTLRII